MDLKEKLKMCQRELEKENCNANLSSILIKNNKEFYLNFHDNENKRVISFLFNKNGNLVSKEEIKEDFRPLKDEDIISEKELEKISDELEEIKDKEFKDFIVSKKNGSLSLVEFDLKKQKITEFRFKDGKKEKFQELDFKDVFRM